MNQQDGLLYILFGKLLFCHYFGNSSAFPEKEKCSIKYFLSYAALIAVLAFSTVTFIKAYNYASEKQVLKEKITSNPDYIKSL
jgi:hypothetical protein